MILKQDIDKQEKSSKKKIGEKMVKCSRQNKMKVQKIDVTCFLRNMFLNKIRKIMKYYRYTKNTYRKDY